MRSKSKNGKKNVMNMNIMVFLNAKENGENSDNPVTFAIYNASFCNDLIWKMGLCSLFHFCVPILMISVNRG